MRADDLTRRWPLIVVAALAPLWAVGMFGRGYYTPDEPREADISWRMSAQQQKSVPLLAGEPFCEKPPLAYWVAGASMALLGANAAAARVPNFFYAALSALALGALAVRAAGSRAAVVAPLIAGSFLMAYQVSIWLATDAPLVAGVSIAMLGLYVGFVAVGSQRKLLGYLLMHLGMAIGFLSKSAIAWIVPGLTLLTVILWERRWRELLRWELYAGLLVQVLLIGPWVLAVYQGPGGTGNLRVFFWNNLVGRFSQVDAPEALRYSDAHRNSPGKYLLEWPTYVFPWVFLFVAAARAAWRGVRNADGRRFAWRFALAGLLPVLILLSFASTARGIYVAPLLPAAGLAIALWVVGCAAAPDRFDRAMLLATAVLVAAFAVSLGLALPPLYADALAQGQSSLGGLIVAAAGVAIGSALAVRSFLQLRGKSIWRGLTLIYAAYLVSMTLTLSYIYSVVDGWQDLAVIARAVRHDVGGRPLILMRPDETTRAIIDMHANLESEIVRADEGAAAQLHLQNLLTRLPEARVLVLEQSRAGGAATQWLVQHGLKAPTNLPRPVGVAWAGAQGLAIVSQYELPQGRRYTLLARAPR
jgi:4-amino-4-deoxy-L-arabinose transferase-like glycosyltransferase